MHLLDMRKLPINQGIQKGKSGLFLTPLLMLYGKTAILRVLYGTQLLYLRIWRNHWAQFNLCKLSLPHVLFID